MVIDGDNELDENLSWNDLINDLIKKIASGIGAFKRVWSVFPATTLTLVYNGLSALSKTVNLLKVFDLAVKAFY